MSIPPVIDYGASERMQHLVNDLRDQIDYYKQLEEKENCHRCHIKEVEFPRRIEKIRDQTRTNTIAEIITLLEDLALYSAVHAIKHRYFAGEWTPAKHSEAVAGVFLEQMGKNSELR